jgi:hypothetical protein
MKDAAKREQTERQIFRRVFTTEDGVSVLTWILNEARYFSSDSREIDPVLMGLCNRLLNKLGIIHPVNLYEDTEARVRNANDRDLEKIINGEQRDVE